MQKNAPKKLLFATGLPELVLSGEKTTTWRVDDPKNIPFVSLNVKVGDQLSFCRNDSGAEFAKAVILAIEKTTFGNLSKEEKEGHEKFASEKEMYETYNRYYTALGIPIIPDTKIKILRFRLL